ncbi:hypothetical protein KBC89_01785 [Candidatus Woesebacteria bacterium]|nr:hypothetical protein [Candidatus Woesebacteria bacterium]
MELTGAQTEASRGVKSPENYDLNDLAIMGLDITKLPLAVIDRLFPNGSEIEAVQHLIEAKRYPAAGGALDSSGILVTKDEIAANLQQDSASDTQ